MNAQAIHFLHWCGGFQNCSRLSMWDVYLLSFLELHLLVFQIHICKLVFGICTKKHFLLPLCFCVVCIHSLITMNLDEEMVVTLCGIYKLNLPKFVQFSHNLLVVISPMQFQDLSRNKHFNYNIFYGIVSNCGHLVVFPQLSFNKL